MHRNYLMDDALKFERFECFLTQFLAVHREGEPLPLAIDLLQRPLCRWLYSFDNRIIITLRVSLGVLFGVVKD
jgi:hypothetical protein